MPDIEKILRVFVSSPADMQSYRDSIVSQVEQANEILKVGTSVVGTAIRVEAILWEADSVPSVTGDGPQLAIDSDIPDDYDIYLGIVGPRFGSVTQSGETGTEHEFNEAMLRYKETGSPHIAVLFCHEGVDPFSLDPEQLKQSQAFRKLVAEIGLYGSFRNVAEFASVCRRVLWKNIFGAFRDADASSAGISSHGIEPDGIGDSIELQRIVDALVELFEVESDAIEILLDVLSIPMEHLGGGGKLVAKQVEEILAMDLSPDQYKRLSRIVVSPFVRDMELCIECNRLALQHLEKRFADHMIRYIDIVQVADLMRDVDPEQYESARGQMSYRDEAFTRMLEELEKIPEALVVLEDELRDAPTVQGKFLRVMRDLQGCMSDTRKAFRRMIAIASSVADEATQSSGAR